MPAGGAAAPCPRMCQYLQGGRALTFEAHRTCSPRGVRPRGRFRLQCYASSSQRQLAVIESAKTGETATKVEVEADREVQPLGEGEPVRSSRRGLLASTALAAGAASGQSLRSDKANATTGIKADASNSTQARTAIHCTCAMLQILV